MQFDEVKNEVRESLRSGDFTHLGTELADSDEVVTGITRVIIGLANYLAEKKDKQPMIMRFSKHAIRSMYVGFHEEQVIENEDIILGTHLIKVVQEIYGLKIVDNPYLDNEVFLINIPAYLNKRKRIWHAESRWLRKFADEKIAPDKFVYKPWTGPF